MEFFFNSSSLLENIEGKPVTKIGTDAFAYCSLTSITIPDSVTSIGEYAFDGCKSLASITIPDSVTYIGYSAFDGCRSLASITIPDSVTHISQYAFNGCSSLKSITIPDSVISIAYNAFDNCSNLTIYGKAGSAAETYASKHNIPFTAQ